MVEFAPSDDPESQRRRSTRLVQSVPLTVEGVDALGQEFKERTSTLIINCHGCKFLSKHYVLKGTWLTLEIPSSQQGGPPTRVRGQVEWVQRPRTVKELFQIGVELETAGNVWGIAFPPADWVSGTAETLPGIPLDALQKPKPAAPSKPPVEEKLQAVPKAAAPTVAPPSVAPPPSVPAPAQALSAAQMEQLLADAREQIQKIVRETVHNLASAETKQLLAQLSHQLQQAANQAVENATREATDQILLKAVQKIEETRKSQSAEMQQAMSAQLERTLSDASAQIITRIQETATPLHDNFRERLDADLSTASGRAQEASRQAEELAATLKVHVAEAQARLAELQQQMEAAAAAAKTATEERARALEESTRQLTKATEDALAHAINEAQGRLAGLRQEMEAAAAEAHATGSAKIRVIGESAESLHREVAESLRVATNDARVQLTELRREMDAAAEAMRSIADERKRDLTASSQRVQAEADASLAEQLGKWREQLESDMALAGTEWNSMLAQAIRSGTERLTGRMDEIAAGTVARADQDLQTRSAVTRQAFEETSAHITQSLQSLLANVRDDIARAGASLAEIDRATSRAEEYSARVQLVSREAAARLEQQAAEIVQTRAAELAQQSASVSTELAQRVQAATLEIEGRRLSAASEIEQRVQAAAGEMQQQKEAACTELSQSREFAAAELARHAEGVAGETLAALRPQLDSTAQQFLSQMASQAEQQIAPQIARASEAAAKLTGTAQEVERDLEAQRARLREQAEEHLRGSLGQLQASSDELRCSFSEAGRSDLEKWLKELDEKSTEATHTTFEALFKSAEWYQKKAQTAMQTALDRVTEESGSRLREQAAEISRIFAGELDHRSRTYVEHTQGILDETVREMTAKAQTQFDELKDTRMAAFDDQTHRLAQGMLDAMGEAAQRSLNEQAERVTAEFRRRLADEASNAAAQAQQDLEASLLTIMDAWRIERDAQLATLREVLGQSSDSSINVFKERLENASNAWLAASMATLQARAHTALTMYGVSTEEKVRESMSKSLAGMADIMRERLLHLSAQLAPPKPEE